VTAALPLPDVAGPLALLVRATLLMGLAWAAAAALRKAGAPAAARHMAWLFGIAALLALPVLWGLVPGLSLPILPAESSPAMAAAASVSAGPVASDDVPVEAGWSVLLLAVYALGAATLLLRLCVGRRMLRRLWSDAGTARDAAWETLLSRLSSEMRLSRRVELRISPGPAVPMTWGTLAPKVLLPAEASEWPLERRRLVLLHELAHVARRDSFSRSLASLACALYWFHPGAWFAARQMRIEQEHAADDRVLTSGGSPQAYALSLLDLAGGPGARPRFDQAAAMAGMYQLERRLVSITSPARRNRPGSVFLSSSALLAGLTTLLAAAGVPVSASSTLPGRFQAKRAEPAGSVRAEESSTRARKTEKDLPAPAGPDNSAGRIAGESAFASESRSNARSTAERPSAGGGEGGPDETEPMNPGEGGSRDRRQSDFAQQIRDYGWELPRPDPKVGIGFAGDSSRPARLVLPARPDSASSERTGRPRWARNVPRLVRGDKPTGSPLSTSQGPLTLSWSIDVGAK